MDKVPMTAAGFQRLQDDLKHLKGFERPAIIRAIAEAREHGDLSENAEYHAARERQSFIEGQIGDVSATLASAPESSRISDAKELERQYLGDWSKAAPGTGLSDPGRQILHCTFGSVLTHNEFGPALRQLLEQHADTYRDVLAFHFGKHLEALRAGM